MSATDIVSTTCRAREPVGEETSRPVPPERATALSKVLHDGPLQSMHAARLALLIAAPLLPPEQADLARRAAEDLLGAIEVVDAAMDELDPDWPLVNARFQIADRPRPPGQG